MEIQISVVIPVYNAEKYVRQAVESVVKLPEVGEIILIDDASPDNAYAICQALEREFEQVVLYIHPDHTNRGAGPTRTLGIQKATYPYIAFLDADDFYLPNRFQKTLEIWRENPTIDGVYECIGTHFEDEKAEKNWYNLGRKSLTTVHNPPSNPNDLYAKLVEERAGHIHLNGLLVRKSLFEKAGFFDDAPIGQDRNMILRLAVCGQLLAGNIESPVAMRRVHAENRITAKLKHNAFWNTKMYTYIMDWMQQNQEINFRKRDKKITFQRFVIQDGKYFNHFEKGISGKIQLIKSFWKSAIKYKEFISLKSFLIHNIMFLGLFDWVKKKFFK